jgi:hypothetical protein
LMYDRIMSFIKILLWSGLLGSGAFSAEPQKTCESAREFITALEFFRTEADFRVAEPEARDLAWKVAKGCTGAARRFIRTAKALTAAGVDRKDSSRFALQFSAATDPQADAFVTVFRSGLASDGLDLSLSDSLKLALALSEGFPGDLERARKDFETMALYCADSTKVGLARSSCADMAARIVKGSAHWDTSVSREWIDAFEFLKSSRGPGLVTADAARLAEDLVLQGRAGFSNFRQSYLYAVSDGGLQMTRDAAIVFARGLAAIQPKNGGPEKAQEPRNSR